MIELMVEFHVIAVIRELRDAEAPGDRPLVWQYAPCRKRRANPFRDDFCVRKGRAGQDDEKLFAAPTSRRVASADRIVNNLRAPLENVVSGRVTEDIVYALEIIEVDHDGGQRFVRHPLLQKFLAQDGLDFTAIV